MACFSYIFIKTYLILMKKSKILNHQRLTKNTLETRINKIFPTDVDENEYLIKNLKEEYDL